MELGERMVEKQMKQMTPTNTSLFFVRLREEIDQELAGYVWHPTTQSLYEFTSVVGLVGILQSLMEACGYPMQANLLRNWHSQGGPLSQQWRKVKWPTRKEMDECSDDEVNYAIKILCRHNVTWQGYVEWPRKGRRAPFYSMLELVRLMSETQEDV